MRAISKPKQKLKALERLDQYDYLQTNIRNTIFSLTDPNGWIIKPSDINEASLSLLLKSEPFQSLPNLMFLTKLREEYSSLDFDDFLNRLGIEEKRHGDYIDTPFNILSIPEILSVLERHDRILEEDFEEHIRTEFHSYIEAQIKKAKIGNEELDTYSSWRNNSILYPNINIPETPFSDLALALHSQYKKCTRSLFSTIVQMDISEYSQLVSGKRTFTTNYHGLMFHLCLFFNMSLAKGVGFFHQCKGVADLHRQDPILSDTLALFLSHYYYDDLKYIELCLAIFESCKRVLPAIISGRPNWQ